MVSTARQLTQTKNQARPEKVRELQQDHLKFTEAWFEKLNQQENNALAGGAILYQGRQDNSWQDFPQHLLFTYDHKLRIHHMVDTGASISIIPRHLVDQAGLVIQREGLRLQGLIGQAEAKGSSI